MRGFDKEAFLKGLGKKAKAEAPEADAPEAEEEMAEEKSPAMRPGKMLLAAVKANDPEAVEEAIRACHGEDYEA